jgi:hypothetical protein
VVVKLGARVLYTIEAILYSAIEELERA